MRDRTKRELELELEELQSLLEDAASRISDLLMTCRADEDSAPVAK